LQLCARPISSRVPGVDSHGESDPGPRADAGLPGPEGRAGARQATATSTGRACGSPGRSASGVRRSRLAVDGLDLDGAGVLTGGRLFWLVEDGSGP